MPPLAAAIAQIIETHPESGRHIYGLLRDAGLVDPNEPDHVQATANVIAAYYTADDDKVQAITDAIGRAGQTNPSIALCIWVQLASRPR